MRKSRKIPVIGVVIAAIFAGLIYLLAWSSIFEVSSVKVLGAPTPDSKVLISTLAAIETGQKLARVEPQALEHRIKNIAWVRNVNISRNWLEGIVTISIQPRIPTAFFNGSTIDATGAIFSLPGFSTHTLPTVSASSPQLGLSAIALFRGLPTEFRKNVTSLSARNSSNFALHATLEGRDIRILWGSDEKSDLKIEVIKALMALEENKNIRRIDVSAPHAPIVK
ncbi:MAG: hypothetical protein RL381_576 [Actinomycetota bacterium]